MDPTDLGDPGKDGISTSNDSSEGPVRLKDIILEDILVFTYVTSGLKYKIDAIGIDYAFLKLA